MKKRLLILFSCALLLPSACGFSAPGKKAERPAIIQKYVALSPKRDALMKAYSKLHYGREMIEIEPRAVVVHWTANDSQEGTYQYFYAEENPGLSHGTLNVGSQFLVGRDGTIWQLMPETALARHAIGLNWCAIGIENVGGVGGKEDLTKNQLAANVALISYLKDKYPTLTTVLGHYEQDKAKQTDLWREDVPNYYHGKIDPGPTFMKGLREALTKKGLTFL
ncbi:N-acetylmuramoyl-L-alanine amidase [uncultured Acidaminococcus sp.]|uniref:N-acetylmuramoyl-L-alanine amidase n=2 Tax=uncultured Acidaminococcus sp. TaxID=352152 RepID=UPI0025FD6B39|nr:peptidoglycan recognition family protein [uncultured Acidaminococcus sp.]